MSGGPGDQWDGERGWGCLLAIVASLALWVLIIAGAIVARRGHF